MIGRKPGPAIDRGVHAGGLCQPAKPTRQTILGGSGGRRRSPLHPGCISFKITEGIFDPGSRPALPLAAPRRDSRFGLSGGGHHVCGGERRVGDPAGRPRRKPGKACDPALRRGRGVGERQEHRRHGQHDARRDRLQRQVPGVNGHPHARTDQHPNQPQCQCWQHRDGGDEHAEDSRLAEDVFDPTHRPGEVDEPRLCPEITRHQRRCDQPDDAGQQQRLRHPHEGQQQPRPDNAPRFGDIDLRVLGGPALAPHGPRACGVPRRPAQRVGQHRAQHPHAVEIAAGTGGVPHVCQSALVDRLLECEEAHREHERGAPREEHHATEPAARPCQFDAGQRNHADGRAGAEPFTLPRPIADIMERHGSPPALKKTRGSLHPRHRRRGASARRPPPAACGPAPATG